jgi:hypothetical protein
MCSGYAVFLNVRGSFYKKQRNNAYYLLFMSNSIAARWIGNAKIDQIIYGVLKKKPTI